MEHIMSPHHLTIATIPLTRGSHATPDEGLCLLEATAYLAGEPHSDHPVCASPVLAAFGRAWNDGMRSDQEREQLKPYAALLIGTAGDREADARRSWMALDWLVRVHTVTWLELAGGDCAVHAAKLAALPALIDGDRARSAQPTINAAWAAAGAAARDAAGAAARDAAWAAARAAARDAAWAAARQHFNELVYECFEDFL